ncbi:hypothetical protein HAX54_039183, partial [Datura stramonium]|nr:hypothetical protein [Datura stramonium]
MGFPVLGWCVTVFGLETWCFSGDGDFVRKGKKKMKAVILVAGGEIKEERFGRKHWFSWRPRRSNWFRPEEKREEEVRKRAPPLLVGGGATPVWFTGGGEE